MIIVGKNLKRLREAKNLSVDDVREYLRLGSVQAVYKYESGKSYPQADTMFALMELYGATVNDITRTHEHVHETHRAEDREERSSFLYLEKRAMVAWFG